MKWLISISVCVIIFACVFMTQVCPLSIHDDLSASSPHGREEWRDMMRGGRVNPEAVLRARNELRAKYEKLENRKDAGLNQWSELNNQEKGGRVRAIAVHPHDPDILYTAGVSGGIWKSTNQGSSWTALNDFLPSLSVASIIIHPDHPDTLYAGTGEGLAVNAPNTGAPGAGIFRSYNGGATWRLIEAMDPDNLENHYWINSLAFDPEDYSKFYATKSGFSKTSPSGGCGELFLFSNHGATKTEVNIECLINPSKIVFNPGNPDNIWLCHTGGLQFSYDKGDTWEEVRQSSFFGWPLQTGRVEVAVSATNPSKLYALCGGVDSASGYLLKSINGGLTWPDQISGLTVFEDQGSYDNALWVDPLDDDHLIIGGINLWKSIDGGATLSQISDGTQNNNGLSPHHDQHVIVAASDYSASNKKIYVGNDGGVATTDDWSTVTTTTGWSLINSGLNIIQYYWSDISGANPQRILAGSQDNGTLRTSDSGASWEKVTGGDGGYCAYSRQDSELQYTSSQYGAVKVKCAGPPWNGNFAPYFFLSTVDDYPPFLATMAVNPTDGELLFIGGTGLWRLTFDSGTCLPTIEDLSPRAKLQGTTITAISYAPDASHVYVGYSNGLLYRGDPFSGIYSWRLIYQGTEPITSIAVNPKSFHKVAISLGGYIEDNILISQNANDTAPANVTWTPRSGGLPAIHVNNLCWHPEQNSWLYAGTDLGIMSTEDNGGNWNVTPNFLGVSDGPAFVEVTKLQFTINQTFGGNVMIATTFGRGIWKSVGLVYSDVYVDGDATGTVFNGRETTPFLNVSDAADVQAHGQTWHVTGDNYNIGAPIILDKRLGAIIKDGADTLIVR